MKRYLSAAFFAAVLVCSSGYAQTTQSRATIPFDFRVGNSSLPAGKYDFKLAGDVLTVYSWTHKSGIFHLTMPTSRTTVNTAGSLQFVRLNGDYYLTNLWMANSNQGLALLQSKRQRELARTSIVAKDTMVPLQRASR